jgi:hypothetical protein
MRAGPSVFLTQAAAVEQEIDNLCGLPITALRLLLHGRIVGGQMSQVKILFLALSMHLQFPIFIQPAGRTSSAPFPTKRRR